MQYEEHKSQVNENFDSLKNLPEQIRLLQERGLAARLNNELPKFIGYFEEIKKLLEVPMMYNTLSDIPIFRAARNKLNELFSTQSRISYNSNPETIEAGKFNVWYQPMFYGCLPYRPQEPKLYPPPRIVAALECCKDLYKPEVLLAFQDITIGRWYINKPFDAINLCFDNVHLQKNFELKKVNDAFFEHMRKAYSTEAANFIKDLYQFFSTLCRTGSDERAYYILTALFASLKIYHKENNGLNIVALISASAASEGHGLNIVIEPSAVNEHLLLNAVIMDRFALVLPEMINYAGYPVSEIVFNYHNSEDFRFSFKSFIPISQDYIKMHHFKDYAYL
jgi:hypothetical protein